MPEQFPSGPAPDAEHREPLTQARYKFIYAHHTPENMGEINAHLEDVDVIAFEPFHAIDEAERTFVEGVMNRALATEATDDDKQAAFEFLADLDSGRLPLMVLERFVGSGKSFALIDITTAHPEYHRRDEVYEGTKRDIRDAFLGGNRDNKSLRGYLERHVKITATSHAEREAVMADRLRQLGQQYPGKQIGVVIGAAHTLVGDAIAQEAETSMVWAVGAGNNPRLHYEDEAIRTMVLEQKTEIDPELLDKMLLQEYFSQFAEPSRMATLKETNLGQQAAKPIDIRYIQDELIDTMTPEEVSAVLAELDDIRAPYDAKTNLKQESVRDELRDKVNVRLNQLIQAHAIPQQNRPD